MTKTAAKTAVDSLRKPQVRLLQALSGEMLRNDWADAATVDRASCTEYVGSVYDEIREVNDEKYFPSLLTLGLVTASLYEMEEGADKVFYSLTKKGQTVAKSL